MAKADTTNDSGIEASAPVRATRRETYRCERYDWGDLHSGCAEDLIARGLLTREMLPGEPGNAKVNQGFNEHGERLTRCAPRCENEGGRHIFRRGRDRYEVHVAGKEEYQRRAASPPIEAAEQKVAPRQPSNVISLESYRKRDANSEVKKTFSNLSERSADGAVAGVVWCIELHDGSHEWGMSGSYRAFPEAALKIVSSVTQKMHRYAARKSIDPVTAEDFLQ